MSRAPATAVLAISCALIAGGCRSKSAPPQAKIAADPSSAPSSVPPDVEAGPPKDRFDLHAKDSAWVAREGDALWLVVHDQRLFHSPDMGSHWTERTPEHAADQKVSVAWTSRDSAWVVLATDEVLGRVLHAVLMTDDAGAHWREAKTALPPDTVGALGAWDAQHAWIANWPLRSEMHPATTPLVILRTTDGGKTFTKFEDRTGPISLYGTDVWVKDATHVTFDLRDEGHMGHTNFVRYASSDGSTFKRTPGSTSPNWLTLTHQGDVWWSWSDPKDDSATLYLSSDEDFKTVTEIRAVRVEGGPFGTEKMLYWSATSPREVVGVFEEEGATHLRTSDDRGATWRLLPPPQVSAGG